MPWFVPTVGDAMLLGVKADSLSELTSLEQKLGSLAGRVRTMPQARRQWKPTARALREAGALSAMPESLEELGAEVFDDPAFAEFAMTAGAESPYRKARLDEAKELDRMPLQMWGLQLTAQGGLE